MKLNLVDSYQIMQIHILLTEINLQTKSGDTSLHLAVEKEHLDIIEFLVRFGADTTILNGNKFAPVHHAIQLEKIASLEVWRKGN